LGIKVELYEVLKSERPIKRVLKYSNIPQAKVDISYKYNRHL